MLRVKWLFTIGLPVQSFDDCVVELGADLLDGLARAIGPRAIGKKGDRELAVGIDPEAGAGVAQMAVRFGAKIFSGL